MALEAIRSSRGSLHILDQLLLPGQSRYEAVESVQQAWEVIRAMKVGAARPGRARWRRRGGEGPDAQAHRISVGPGRCAAPQPSPWWVASAWPWSCA